jgi:hypothetical protein
MKFLLSALTLTLIASPLAANMVDNPDFETGDFTDWFHAASVVIVEDNGPSAPGDYAAEITATGDLRTVAIPVASGGIYDIKFDYKSIGMDGAYWGGIRYWSGADTSGNPTGWLGQTIYQFGPAPNGLWLGLSAFESTAPAGAAYADVAFFADSATTGLFYVDNVSVTLVPEPAAMMILALGGLLIRRK